MMNRFARKMLSPAVLVGALIAVGGLSGCVQMPTETSGVVSLKPQIAFRLANEGVASANVMLDGLPVGMAGQFVAGKSALQIEPGSHQLQVHLNGNVLLSEKFYVGDGVNKTFDLR